MSVRKEIRIMGCRSDYLAATGQEMESVRVCKFIVWILEGQRQAVPDWIKVASEECYGNTARLDEATKILCSLCRGFSKQEVDKYLYDAKDPTSRKLASWFDRHSECDERRVLEEKEARKKAELRKTAMKKLTTDELDALGLLPD
jgi:hypothetical protein